MRVHRLVALALWFSSAGAMFGPAVAMPAVARPTAVTPAAPALATAQTPGLAQEVSTSYRVDSSAIATHVSVSATLTNTTGDRIFLSFGIPAPSEATNLAARTSTGDALPVSTEAVDGTEQVELIHAGLGSGLQPRQTLTVRFGYDLVAQPPRSIGLSQANEAFFMFPVRPLGDPGSSSVEVRVPATYEIDLVGDELERREEGGEVVLEAEGIANPLEFWAMVLAMDESKLVTEPVEVADTTAELRAWPGDTEWASFVAGLLADGIEVLEELIGQPWPTEEDLTIVETMTPLARGYGGWYDPTEHTIRIGNELDPHLVLHELSHVWINFALFQDRWLLEGFAEEYAHRSLLELGRPVDRELPGPVPPEGRLVPLGDWVTPVFGAEESDDVERYGYAASWHVVGSIAEEIGTEALGEVVEAAARREVTYPLSPDADGESNNERLDAPMDWRRLLDLFENVGGSEGAGELFSSYVVSPSELSELDERSETRTAYLALAERGGEWVPPLEARSHMAMWDFEEATASIQDAAGVLDLRDRIDEVLEGLDVDPSGLEEDYESAGDVDALVTEAEDTLAAAEAYREARAQAARGRNPLEAIGLWWSGAGGQLADARSALTEGDPAASAKASEAVVGLYGRAAKDGALRIGGTVMVVTGAALLPLRRRQQPPNPAPKTEAPSVNPPV